MSTDSVSKLEARASITECHYYIFDHGRRKEKTSHFPFVGNIDLDSLRETEYKYLNVIFSRKKISK